MQISLSKFIKFSLFYEFTWSAQFTSKSQILQTIAVL